MTASTARPGHGAGWLRLLGRWLCDAAARSRRGRRNALLRRLRTFDRAEF